MKILIAERLKPFSHTPGTGCLIPGTCWEIEAFPTLIRLGKKYDLHLHITGPVEGFTLEQDLEKNCVWIFGRSRDGFYRLKIQGSPDGIEVKTLNAPKTFLINGSPSRSQERLSFSEPIDFFLPQCWERLSFGVSKSQDWDLVLRRMDLREILPVLFGLGQKIPYMAPVPLRGTGRLLEEEKLDLFCRAGFSKILIPRFVDDQYQGLSPIERVAGHPCYLLQQAVVQIRRLFFFQEKSRIFLLQQSLFDAGRMTGVSMGSLGEIDLEWASHHLRRVCLRVNSSQEVIFDVKKCQSFRVRTSPSQRGKRHMTTDFLFLEAGKTYLLDRFQKP